MTSVMELLTLLVDVDVHHDNESSQPMSRDDDSNDPEDWGCLRVVDIWEDHSPRIVSTLIKALHAHPSSCKVLDALPPSVCSKLRCFNTSAGDTSHQLGATSSNTENEHPEQRCSTQINSLADSTCSSPNGGLCSVEPSYLHYCRRCSRCVPTSSQQLSKATASFLSVFLCALMQHHNYHQQRHGSPLQHFSQMLSTHSLSESDDVSILFLIRKISYSMVYCINIELRSKLLSFHHLYSTSLVISPRRSNNIFAVRDVMRVRAHQV